MSVLAHITVNPAQCGGRPCIRGMRIRVKDILDLLAAGVSTETILQTIPILRKKISKRSLNLRRPSPTTSCSGPDELPN
ncbi:MAG: DUF433 domain-containing protein [Nitrospira sp.]|nr:DUF433 domain-containing protein [Nitrospira sp.]